jgi:hypothetical protein
VINDPETADCAFCEQPIVVVAATQALARHYEQPRRDNQPPCDGSGLQPFEAAILRKRTT